MGQVTLVQIFQEGEATFTAVIQRAWKFFRGTAQLPQYFYPEEHSKDT